MNLIDVEYLMAPRKKRSAPKHVAHVLDQTAWTLQCERDVGDFRISGYLFDQWAVYLYTRQADDMFVHGTTPHIHFFLFAKEWDHFRGKICKELNNSLSLYNRMDKCLERTIM